MITFITFTGIHRNLPTLSPISIREKRVKHVQGNVNHTRAWLTDQKSSVKTAIAMLTKQTALQRILQLILEVWLLSMSGMEGFAKSTKAFSIDVSKL